MTRHAIWSDFRGVLTPPLGEGVRDFCEGTDFTAEQIFECLRVIGQRYDCLDGMAVLDSGILDERQWTTEIETELRLRFGVRADLSDFGARWWSDQRVDQAWVAAVRAWRAAGVFVGLMSNLPLEWKGHLESFPAVADTFDDVLLSCDIGARKPEAEIFRLAAARSGVESRFCVLVDDLPDNVAGARAAGWTGVLSGGDATQSAITFIDSLMCGEAVTSEGGWR